MNTKGDRVCVHARACVCNGERVGYARKRHKLFGAESVLGRRQEVEGWRRLEGLWTVMPEQEGRVKERKAGLPPCLRCKFVPVAIQAQGEGPLLLFLFVE